MHQRLEQHIKQHLGEDEALPENFQALLRDVDRAYELLDQQRADLMETLEQSARTMLERNAILTRNLESQRKSQQQLSQSYEVLNATLNASNEGILVVDNDDSVVAFNDRDDVIRTSDYIYDVDTVNLPQVTGNISGLAHRSFNQKVSLGSHAASWASVC